MPEPGTPGRPGRRLEGGRAYRGEREERPGREAGEGDDPPAGRGRPEPEGETLRREVRPGEESSGAGGRTAPGRAGGRVTGGDPDRSRVATAASVLRAVPGFAKLLYRLMKDPRVSPLDRALFGFTLAYLFIPADIIPDWIPGFGALDDLVLLGLALDRLLYRADSGVLLEHWEGDPYPLVKIREVLDRVAQALPPWARWMLRSG